MGTQRGTTARHHKKEFEPTDAQRRAIEDAEAFWQQTQSIYEQFPDDLQLRTDLKAASSDFAAALAKLLGPEGAAVRASLLAQMQVLGGEVQGQAAHHGALEQCLNFVLLLKRASAAIAPAPGRKSSPAEQAFIAIASHFWLRETGTTPTARGAFAHTIAHCINDPDLRELKADRLDEALKRLTGN